MRNVKMNVRCLCLSVAAVCCVLSARQVCANPPPSPHLEAEQREDIRTAPLVIKVSKDQVLNRIVIPRKYITEATGLGAGFVMSVEGRTIVAGGILSLVVVASGLGLAFARRRKTRFAGAAAIVMLMGGPCLVGTTVADHTPPTSAVVSEQTAQDRMLVVEMSEAGDSVILIIGRESAGDLQLK